MHKIIIKRLLKPLNVINQFNKRNVAILKYHSVQNEPELFDDSIGIGIIHQTSVFKKQMEIVAKQFNPLSMDDLSLVLSGEKEMPKKPVVVTFDDGFADNFDIAAAILDHFGIRATLYVTVGSIESRKPLWVIRLRHAIWITQKDEWVIPGNGTVIKLQNRDDRIAAMRLASKQCAKLFGAALEKAICDIEQSLCVETFRPKNSLMMNWENIKKLYESGHTIGSHTINHLNLAHLKREETLWELNESKDIIEKKINAPVIHFSYPNPALIPSCTDETTAFVREAGYKTAVKSTSGPVRIDDNPLSLDRVWGPRDLDRFLWNLECSLLGRRV